MTAHAILVAALALVGCGRIGFDSVGDGAIGDGAIGDADVVLHGCSPTPRPTGTPTTFIGTGMPASCTEAAIAVGLAAGGWIGFNCGTSLVTINVTAELSITQPTILDGGGRVTLNGGSLTRVLNINAGDRPVALIDLVIMDGASTGPGAGVLIQSGQVTIIGTTLHDNHGPDASGSIGGGAISSPPTGGTLAIYESVFRDNRSANGGAIMLWSDLTIAESSFTNNRATGTGGDTGNGGLGGAINNAGRGNLTMCGVTFDNNTAGELGGALHRVCTDSSCVDQIHRTSIVSNTAPNAAGAYHQGPSLMMSQTTIARNVASMNVGGLWHLGTNSAFVAENVTVANNSSGTGTGAGLSVNAASGSISFSTITTNMCTGSTCSSAAIAATSTVSLRATLVANNTISAQNVPLSCGTQMVDGLDNFQWPVARPGGGTDDPTALCATGVRIQDPMLPPIGELAGPAGRFLVARPTTGSPALAITSMCPAEDQLGRPRPTPCSAGAVEP